MHTVIYYFGGLERMKDEKFVKFLIPLSHHMCVWTVISVNITFFMFILVKLLDWSGELNGWPEYFMQLQTELKQITSENWIIICSYWKLLDVTMFQAIDFIDFTIIYSPMEQIYVETWKFYLCGCSFQNNARTLSRPPVRFSISARFYR